MKKRLARLAMAGAMIVGVLIVPSPSEVQANCPNCELVCRRCVNACEYEADQLYALYSRGCSLDEKVREVRACIQDNCGQCPEDFWPK